MSEQRIIYSLFLILLVNTVSNKILGNNTPKSFPFFTQHIYKLKAVAYKHANPIEMENRGGDGDDGVQQSVAGSSGLSAYAKKTGNTGSYLEAPCDGEELTALSQSNVGVTNPNNAVGLPDLAYADMRGGDILTLDLGQEIAVGEVVQLALTRGNRWGLVEIEGSTNASSEFSGNIRWGNPNDATTTLDATVAPLTYETINYTAPAGGLRYIRFTRIGGQVRVDGVSYCNLGQVACDASNNINFDTAPNGNPISAGTKPYETWASQGVHISTNSTSKPPMIFDSSNPSGNDRDLGTPHQDFGGPGHGTGGKTGAIGENNKALGNLLIISKDGNSNNPDDNASGGTIYFNFDNNVDISSIDIIDLDYGNTNGMIKAYDASDNLIGEKAVIAYGDNSYQKIVLEFTDVRKIAVIIPNSFSVAALNYCDSAIPTASIGNLVWNDANNDGLSTGESGISNVDVSLYDNANHLLAVTTTDNQGHYAFENLAVGQYRISIDLPNGYSVTHDLDGNGNDNSGIFTLSEDINKLDVDFGLNNGSTGGNTEGPEGCNGNGAVASGSTRNGSVVNATGEPDGSTTEVGSNGDYLVVTLTAEIPAGTQYTIHMSGRNGSATTDVFEAPNGTNLPNSRQSRPNGFTQNGQATGANNVITEVVKTANVATRYLYFDRGSGDIEIDAVTYQLDCDNGPEICGNGIDDDNNGLTDCADNVCGITVDLGSDIIHCGDAKEITAAVSGSGLNFDYSWNNSLGNAASHLVDPEETTTYTVVVTNEYGCSATAQITLTVDNSCTEICDNGIDDDGDGLVDCYDPDCANSGTAMTVVASNGNNVDPNNAIGAADGVAAKLYNVSDLLTLDLGTTLDAGTEYTIIWKRKGSYSNADVADIKLEESTNNSDWTTHLTTPQTASKTDFVHTVIAAQTNVRYLRFSELTGNGDDFDLDAVTFTCHVDEICDNGIDDDGDGRIDENDGECNSCQIGFISYEIWRNLSGSSINDLTDADSYPDLPSEKGLYDSFQGIANTGDNYGTRVRGFIHPAETGDYIFTLTSDDASELYLSTDANVQHKTLIAQVGGWTNVSQFTKYTEQISTSIFLEAGKKYYVETLHKEGGGGDHLQVYWQTPSNNSQTIIPGSHLSPWDCAVEICGNNVDDDQNGLTDCDDPACNNGLAISVALASPTVCNGESTILSASAVGGDGNYTFSWDNGLENGNSHNVTPTATTTYNVAVTDGAGCTATNQITITVNTCNEICDNGIDDDFDGLTDCDDPDCTNGLAVVPALIKTTICTGESTVLSATATGGNGNYIFTWDNELPMGESNTISPSANTTYTVVVTDDNGCTATSQISITVGVCTEICGNGMDDDFDGLTDCEDPDCANGLAVTATLTNSTICNGGEVQLSASATGGDNNYTYSWDNGLANGASHTVNPSVNTTYVVVVTDGNGCTATHQVELTVEACAEICDNGMDDDLDGDIDSADSDCACTTELANLALGKPATQSSDYNAATGASLAVDGNTSGIFNDNSVTHTGGGDTNPQWNLDLGSVKEIKNIRIWNRTDDCCRDRLSNFYVFVSDLPFTDSDPTITATEATVWNEFIINHPIEKVVVSPFRTGRYVRIQLVGNGALSLAEVEVIGCQNPEICDDNIDNDEDGLIDCEDPDCSNNLSLNVGANKTDICSGDNATLTTNTSGGDSNYTVSWDNGLADGDVHTVNPTVTTTYNATVTDGNGCTATNSITIIVNVCNEICGNGLDDDFDGLTDCDDPDCNPSGDNIIAGCITVNSTSDLGDTNPGDGKCQTVDCNCTLRAAIEEANALAGKDTICFNIPESDANYDGTSWKIVPPSVIYEDLAEAGIFINGYTQSGSVPAIAGNSPILKIEVSGELLPAGTAIFQTMANNNKIAGLVINGAATSNTSAGIRIKSDHNEIVGNFIGVGVDAATAKPNGLGISIENGVSNMIGGINREDANLIAFNTSAGIAVLGMNSNQNSILGNNITSNDGLGIDLSTTTVDDVTENDDNDANGLLNFPELAGAAIIDGDLYYDFDLDVPTGEYRIEFFNNTNSDPSGHGEGAIFIGHTNISHEGNGTEKFYGVFTPEVATPVGIFITLTATKCTDGTCTNFEHTSEFNGTLVSERCQPLVESGSILGDESGCLPHFNPSTITSVSDGSGGEGGPIYYQWQQLPAGETIWTDIVGATANEYTPPALSITTKFRRNGIRGKCSTQWLTSNEITKTIYEAVTAEIIDVSAGLDGTLCGAAAYEFKAADAGLDAEYFWYFGENATPTEATGIGPHIVGFLSLADTAINNQVILEVDNGICTNQDTVDFSINPVVTDIDIQSTNPVVCGGAGGVIEIIALGERDLCLSVSLDGGDTFQPDGQLTFTDLSAGIYNIVLSYCDVECPNAYSLVNLVEPSNLIAAADLIDNACPGFRLEGNVAFNDINTGDAIYTLESNPTKGTVTMSTNGTFEYIPNVFECAVDQFFYRVCDQSTGCCATANVTLSFEDDQKPELRNVPADLTINCDEEIPLAPLVSAFDNCPSISIDKAEVSTQGEDGCSLYDYTLTRTWTATDICGNQFSDQQVIEIQDITAPNIYRVYTLPNGKKMVAGVMKNVTSRWKTIQFPIDFPSRPVILTQMTTGKDSSTTIVRMRNTSIAQFEMKLQEEESNDGFHLGENVAWIAMEEGVVNSDYHLEVGKVAVSDALSSLNFNDAFTDMPAFFSAIGSVFESDPATVYHENLTTNQVRISLEEEISKDEETAHTAESVAYVAVDQSAFIKNNKGEVIGEVGTVEMNTEVIVVNTNNYYYNPVVIAKYTDGTPNVVGHIIARTVSNNSFELELTGWDYQNNQDNTYGNGKVSLMIIEGSLPLDISPACINEDDSLTLGVDIVAIDNCDNNVSIEFEETISYDGSAKFVNRSYSAIDECGNKTALNQLVTCSGVAVRVNAFLQGAAISGDIGLMRDDLRRRGLIPLMEPYTDLENYRHFGTGGREIVDQDILDVEGEDAVVDWVMIELRGGDNPSEVISTQSALIRRTGEVINTEGDSVLIFENVPSGNYFVSIKHRNHLAMYSLYPMSMGPAIVPFVDFTNSFTPVMGDVSGIEFSGKRALWSGDINADSKIIFQGPHNDIFFMFMHILQDEENQRFLTNYISTGYTQRDFNMDGDIIYQGPGNDRSPLLYHTVLIHPENGTSISNFVVETGVESDSIIIEPEWIETDECAVDYTLAVCDFDGDGLVNSIDTDKDNDGVIDSLDVAIFDKDSDSDGDGISDFTETSENTNPLNACDPNPSADACIPLDEDGDGFFGNYPTNNAHFDELDNEACFPNTNNQNCDCLDMDGDGKVAICHIPDDNYANRRTEKVLLKSYIAHKDHGDICGPCNYDEDGDGVNEPQDSDPQNPDSDSDNDGVSDIIETGGDGVYNAEVDMNPLNPDTDADGLMDGEEDSNGNGIIEEGESNPLIFCSPIDTINICDFDKDGISNQADLDDDGDGVTDDKDADMFDPESDTDLDGVSDLAEKGISDPLNACDPAVVDGLCVGIDRDNDGFFGNYPAGHTLFDLEDDNECVPSVGTSTTFFSAFPPNKDTYLHEKEKNKNYGLNNKLELEESIGNNVNHLDGRHILIQFDVSNVNATILQSAKLKLYVTDMQTDGVIVEAYKTAKSWDEGTKKNANGVPNWQYRKNNTSWSKVGGDFYPTIYGSKEVIEKGWLEIDLPNNLIEDWIANPSENYGLLLRASLSSNTGLIKFTSGEYPEENKRPFLELELMVDLCGEDGQSGSSETGASITDTDGDGIYDHIETGGDGIYNEGIDTDPNNADTDGDGLLDGEEDANRDGTVNGDESNPRYNCSPFAIGLECDFDGDGWINLFDWDDDDDGVVDLQDADKFNPESDTDNDGLSDIAERGNSAPLNPCDPDDDAAACIGTDNDHDGFYTNVPANDPKYDSNDSDACVPESGNGVCDGCTVNNKGRMVICHRPFGTSVPFKFNLEIYARDWVVYKSLGGTCGPCN